MGIIVLLISISVTIALGFVLVFYWNMKSGQYEDTYTPSVRILFDEATSDRHPLTNSKCKASPGKSSSMQVDSSLFPDKDQEML